MTDFYEHMTTYKSIRATFRKSKAPITEGPVEWYKKHGEVFAQSSILNRQGNELLIALTESRWHEIGEPSFKIYPDLLLPLAECSIDIPWTALQHPYPSFAIEMPRDVPEMIADPGGPPLRSILVSRVHVEKHSDKTFSVREFASGAEVAFHVIYIFAETLVFDFLISAKPGIDTIEERYESMMGDGVRHQLMPDVKQELDRMNGGAAYVPSLSLLKKVLNLSIAVCFFGINNHELVMPNLTRRQILKRADRDRISELEAFKREGEEQKKSQVIKHWGIGRELHFPRPVVVRSEREDSESSHELSAGYIRRGHLRYQACGEGRKERKLIFISPHAVRPDLGIKTKTPVGISGRNCE